ncbi:MAG: OmpA family protein [Bacteroidia bacterium]|nr:OmpA family protein [Bacteroidia bacterium]
MLKKRLLSISVAALFAGSIFTAGAQNADHKFGVELNGGLREYQGDLGSSLFFQNAPNYQAVGLNLGYYISPSFDAVLYASVGEVGFHTQKPFLPYPQSAAGFRAQITDFNGGIRFKILKGRKLTPYLMAGWGALYIQSQLDNDPNAYSAKYSGQGNLSGAFGIQYSFSPRFGIRLQSMANYTFNDVWDGEPYSYGTHTRNKNNDMYMYHSFGLVYNFGAASEGGGGMRDKDKDGVPDKLDLCPKTKPYELPVNEDGCPKDSDNDSIPDYMDSCINQAGPRKFNGCPDTDKDGIKDAEDRCPNNAGSIEFKGCPDTDGDGIPDIDDECPAIKGLAVFKGCPDTDGDGIENRKDKCPDVAGDIAGEGCPDTDGDGVYDNIDRCINKPGTLANKGCPEIKQEVKERIKLAAKGIFFETGKDVIKAESFDDLDKLVSILNEYPESSVYVEGHTDDVGDDAANLDLSQRRANSVKTYLQAKGVAAERLTSTGYGETKPVADNKTKAGKALNRRVDFNLVY